MADHLAKRVRADIVEQESDIDRLAKERVTDLQSLDPEHALLELAKIYVTIDRIGPLIQTAVWAVGKARKAIEVGGELVGGDGACDCFIDDDGVRTCPDAVLKVGGLNPTLPPNDPRLRSARWHALAVERILRDQIRLLEGHSSRHQSISKLIASMKT